MSENTNIYVGNIPYSADEEVLKELFSQHGVVDSVKIITDRDSGKSKGFAFINMASEEDTQSAISNLHESDMDGRKLVVNIARPRKQQENRSY